MAGGGRGGEQVETGKAHNRLVHLNYRDLLPDFFRESVSFYHWYGLPERRHQRVVQAEGGSVRIEVLVDRGVAQLGQNPSHLGTDGAEEGVLVDLAEGVQLLLRGDGRSLMIQVGEVVKLDSL